MKKLFRVLLLAEFLIIIYAATTYADITANCSGLKSTGLSGVSMNAIHMGNNLFRAYYMSGSKGLVTARSDDADNWTVETVTVLSSDGSETIITNPWVILTTDKKYRMIYETKDSSGNSVLKTATSTNSVTFTREGTAITGTSEDIDPATGKYFISVPTGISTSPGYYRMYFVSGGSDIRSAVSADDGKTWTRETGVRIKDGVDPAIFELIGGGYGMFYTDWSGAYKVKRVLYATAADGLDFNPSQGVIVSVNDSSSIVDPEVIPVAGGTTLRLFFSQTGGTDTIYTCTLPPYISACTAIFTSNDSRLHTPVLSNGGADYLADFQYTASSGDLSLISSSPVSSSNYFKYCNKAEISSGTNFHIPSVLSYGSAFSFDFKYKGGVSFSLNAVTPVGNILSHDKSYTFTPTADYSTGVFCRLFYNESRGLFYLTLNGYKAGATGNYSTSNQEYAWYELDKSLTATGKHGKLPIASGGDYAIAYDGTWYYFLGGSMGGYTLYKLDADFALNKSTNIAWDNTKEAGNDQMMNFRGGKIYAATMYDTKGISDNYTSGSTNGTTFTHLFTYDTSLNKLDDRYLMDESVMTTGGSFMSKGGIYHVVTSDIFFPGRIYAYKWDSNWTYLGKTLLAYEGQWSQGVISSGERYYVAYHTGLHGSGNIALGVYDSIWNPLYIAPVTSYNGDYNGQRPWVTVVDDTLYVSYDVATSPDTQHDWQCHVKTYKIKPSASSDYDKASAKISEIYNLYSSFFGTKSGDVTTGTTTSGTFYVQWYTNGTGLLAWTDGYMYYYYIGKWNYTGTIWK
ncbi:MAG: hypothetical protein HQL01_10130 [Nitrospirae bacterium]|nr:hypothetical protein [Nitrospirota bacterium]